MIVLIAPETDVPNEIEILHDLFREGLSYYHLRKPSKGYHDHAFYLQQIDVQYHNRIITHYHHELINTFSLKGIHFQEQKRRDVLETKNRYAYLNNLQINDKTMSSSFHDPKTIENCDIKFDYHLLSPVFSSISKPDYEGRCFTVNHIPKKTIGMGGVTQDNLNRFKLMGYQGVGVLGGVWYSENPIESFKHMIKSATSIFV